MSKFSTETIVSSIFKQFSTKYLTPEFIRDEANRLCDALGESHSGDPGRCARDFATANAVQKDGEKAKYYWFNPAECKDDSFVKYENLYEHPDFNKELYGALNYMESLRLSMLKNPMKNVKDVLEKLGLKKSNDVGGIIKSELSPEERKQKFADYLKNVAKKKNGQSLAEKTIGNYLFYLPEIVNFIKNIHIENIYEISSVDLVLQIQEELGKNEEFLEANKNGSARYNYSSSLKHYKNYLIYDKEKDFDFFEDDELLDTQELPPLDPPTQIIYYGVPGCGKSHAIQGQLESVAKFNKIRTVFHPEYTNADFIGQILPEVHINEDNKSVVEYKFKPGPFTEIIRRAYLNPDEKFYLVIEEINRGNAAAIFGETFQLLDRIKSSEDSSTENIYKKDWSKYGVDNVDVNAYIRKIDLLKEDRKVADKDGSPKKAYGSLVSEILPQDVREPQYYASLNIPFADTTIHFSANTAIRLPPNLSILATMNTSDQNVFTLDNAFQRRFDMQLVRNESEKDESQNQFGGYKDADVQKQHDATIAGTNVKWGDFWAWINNKIVTTLKGLSSTEDKRLGVWFVSNVDGKIDEKVFAEKVLKYLWDDAFKFKRPQIFAPEIDTLERLIAAFEKPDSGKNRFEVFKDFSNLMSSVAAPPQNNGAANS